MGDIDGTEERSAWILGDLGPVSLALEARL